MFSLNRAQDRLGAIVPDFIIDKTKVPEGAENVDEFAAGETTQQQPAVITIID
ncbi:hypothetical protein [Bradyrhizobium sp. AUGA SZCCT0182]|uniref:hypothetical protein n=1 Tax=Bradyrhizobium sp. AUGA SZCCT0182 TaxID=2807667 RepID=UPI001BA577A8|nr:hypothetical protein [Bradyrhizobium sp. AUGA SZCCT0182]MBR1238182.1 hypothetical protein [Bradyrhizobium sp. AUGA SZCCT0182]